MIRYVHRLVANSIMSGTETSSTLVDEFNLLISPFIPAKPVVNLVAVLARSLISLKHIADDLEPTKSISMRFGSIITRVDLVSLQ